MSESPRPAFLIMKIAALVLMAGVFALLTYHSNLHERLFATSVRHEVPDLGPESARPDIEGFEKWRGQVVHLAFWATWCEPCQRELPAIEELVRRYGRDENGAPRLQVVLVNLDAGEKALAEAKRMQRQLAPSVEAIYENTAALAQDRRVEVLPFHTVLDKKGRIAAEFYAALDTQLENFRNLLLQLFAEAPEAE